MSYHFSIHLSLSLCLSFSCFFGRSPSCFSISQGESPHAFVSTMRHCFRILYHVFDLLPRQCEGATLYGNKGLRHTLTRLECSTHILVVLWTRFCAAHQPLLLFSLRGTSLANGWPYSFIISRSRIQISDRHWGIHVRFEVTVQSWRWKHCVPPEHHWNPTVLHRIMSQKILFFHGFSQSLR